MARTLKVVAYLLAAVAMGYYRLLKSASTSFNNNEIAINADSADMIPLGARHIWIPLEHGDELSAWLIAPQGEPSIAGKAIPIVVMANGFGNQKDMGLFQYAHAFSEDGIAALVIDYRGFGGSSRNHWMMRNYINPSHHVQDIVSTVHFIRLEYLIKYNIDANMIALWGTAFAGGHVIMAAEILGPDLVKGVISLSPHLDGRAFAWRLFSSRGILGTLKFASLAATDYLRSVVWLSPLYVKIISDNSTEVSFLSVNSNELEAYYSKHPKKYVGGWENKAPARTFFLLPFYSPIAHIKNVKVK
jgi:pimeloyl-ACP methyl ester carboxylesterase